MTRNKTIQEWDRIAGRDDAQGHIHPSGHHGVDAYNESGLVDCALAFEAFGPDRLRVMDYGSGDGRVAQHLASLYDVVCVDSSPRMLELAQDRIGTAADYHCWSGLVPWDADPVDAVFSTAVFIHHPITTGARILANLAEAVKPGGLLALQIPLYSVPRIGLSHLDVTVWTLGDLAPAADAAGCEIVSAYWHDHPFSFDNIGVDHRRLQILRRRST